MEENLQIDSEDNIKFFYNFIFRNKKFITLFSFTFFLIACLYALSLKRIWAGNFQIVLRERNNSNSIKSNISPLKFVAGLNDQPLKTEVAILESRSVLMPIFQFSNEEKKKINPKFKTPLFENWAEDNLNIRLKKGTQILNIIYKDNEKKLILPVLDKISDAYQEYSLRNKKRSVELTKDYLKEKISVYEIKSSNSLKKAQEFAFDEDLQILIYNPGSGVYGNTNNNNILSQKDFLFSDPGSTDIKTNSDTLISNINVEATRVKNANIIKEVDLLLDQINEIKNLNELKFFDNYNSTYKNEVEKDLQKLDQTILELETKYTNLDPNLIRLKKKRDFMLQHLKDETIINLKNQKRKSQAIMKASTRPKEVLNKYKALVREASRDENTLIKLEEQLALINLEEAKRRDPWELITESNLRPNPVAPSRTRIGLIGLFLGFIFSLIIAYKKEKESDLIYEEEQLELESGTQVLENINLSTKELKNYTKSVFINEILNKSKNKDLVIIKSNKISQKNCEVLFDSVLENNFNFAIEENFTRLKDEKVFLLVNIGTLTYKELKNIKTRLLSVNKKIYKIILVSF